jgi:peptide/nickel transport system substrate-binding protein
MKSAGKCIFISIFCIMVFFSVNVYAQGTLRIGMTTTDIPMPTGNPDMGAEGIRFMGLLVYDPLVMWDLSSANKPSELIPGLATEWTVDPKDKKVWVFRIRRGVKFHDGSEFTADAAVWNFEKILNDKSPQYDPKQAGQARGRIPSVAGYKAIDKYTLQIMTKDTDAFLPYQVNFIMMSSPAQWEKLGKSWDAFAKQPSGTGPWKLVSVTPRERAELVKNSDYWDKKRVPKLDKLILMPTPEANTRVSALRSGQVDWIEAPPPDAVSSLKAAGFEIVTNSYTHNWTWHFSFAEGSPWNDIRIRKAANLAVDRESMKKLLGGMMISGKGLVPEGHPWFGKPSFNVRYDVAEAKKLMAEAGYSKEKPVTIKTIITPSGSGQMQPLPMNEFIQENLAEIGIKVQFEVMEWNAMVSAWRAGAKSEASRGAHSLNQSYYSQDPFTCFVRHLQSDQVAPRGTNWGYYSNKDMDDLFFKARNAFESAQQRAALQAVHEKIVNDALFLFVCHDVNPRGLSPKVKGFVQAQNWYQDLSPITMAK